MSAEASNVQGVALRPRRAARLRAAGALLASDASLTIGGIMFVAMIVAIAFGPFVVPYDARTSGPDVLAEPSLDHFLGTDSIGRDVLARLILGAGSSLFIAVVATIVSMALGTAVGVTAAYFGGLVDWIEMRIVDMLLSMPPLLVAIAVLAALGPSITTLLFVLVITHAPQIVRIVRASSLQMVQRGYVESARISGLPAPRIMWTHILPNIRGILIVQTTITVAQMLMVETILSFLGLGVRPPTPNLGFMLAEGRQWMELAPWVVIAPGCVVVFAVATFTFIGHGLDKALAKRS